MGTEQADYEQRSKIKLDEFFGLVANGIRQLGIKTQQDEKKVL